MRVAWHGFPPLMTRPCPSRSFGQGMERPQSPPLCMPSLWVAVAAATARRALGRGSPLCWLAIRHLALCGRLASSRRHSSDRWAARPESWWSRVSPSQDGWGAGGASRPSPAIACQASSLLSVSLQFAPAWGAWSEARRTYAQVSLRLSPPASPFLSSSWAVWASRRALWLRPTFRSRAKAEGGAARPHHQPDFASSSPSRVGQG